MGIVGVQHEGVHAFAGCAHRAFDALRERLRGVLGGHQLDDAALGRPADGAEHTPFLVQRDGADIEPEPSAVDLRGAPCIDGGHDDAGDARQPRVATLVLTLIANGVVGIDPYEHPVGGSRVHVAPARALHEREHVESSAGQCHRLGVRIGRLQHQRVRAFAPPIEELLQAPAQRHGRIGRTHQLDVAPTLGYAHAHVCAETGDRAVGEIHDRHAEDLAEGEDGLVEVVNGDGDAGHGGDHGRPPVGVVPVEPMSASRCAACTTRPTSSARSATPVRRGSARREPRVDGARRELVQGEQVNEIIVGVDGSETGHGAAREASLLASSCNRPLHLVMAITDRSVREVHGGGETWQLDPVTQAEATLAELSSELSDGLTITTAVVADHAAAALCAEAERLGASLIVVGNNRLKGVSRLLGSVAGDVVRHAPCSVLVSHRAGS